MPVISVPQAFNEDELYVDLRSIFGQSLFLKCEGFNFAGSIKLKAATEMVEAADRDGVLTPGRRSGTPPRCTAARPSPTASGGTAPRPSPPR